jgi:hypothetical protein
MAAWHKNKKLTMITIYKRRGRSTDDRKSFESRKREFQIYTQSLAAALINRVISI